MDKFKKIVMEHRTAALICLFLLIVFIGGSAMSAVTLFSGSISPPEVRLIPMRRASSQESSGPWQLNGASP